MKAVTIAAAMLALSGCDTVRAIFPHTTAGFEANGIVGAIDGASDALLATCRMLDGQVVRVAVDDVATSTGKGDLLGTIRQRRQQACAVIGAVQLIADGIDAAEASGAVPAEGTPEALAGIPAEVNVHMEAAPAPKG